MKIVTVSLVNAVTFTCLAAVLLLPGALFAQSAEQPPSTAPALFAPASNVPSVATADTAQLPAAPVIQQPTRDANRGLRLPIAIWAASVAADQTTTYMFSSRYQGVLHERNFLIRGLDSNPAALVAAGTAIDVATGVIAYRLLRNHPRLAKLVFFGAAAYRSYLAAYNIRMMSRADALAAATGRTAVR